MAATKKGVWDLQDVRDKQLASEWAYEAGAALWVWGSNTRGMFGLNQSQASLPSLSSPTQVGTDTSWYKFAKGDGAWTWQTGAVKIDGTLWSWGYNSRGTLGHNNTVMVSSPTQVGTDTTWNNMATDREVMAAVKTDGTLWIWGYNNDGKLGLNQAYPGLNNISSPTQIPGTTWREAACDYDSVLATKTDGTLWAWGSNFYGELGQNQKGIPANRSSPTQIPGTTWVRVTANTQTVLATKSDNTLWGWGFNDHGSIGANIGWPKARSSPTQIPGEWDPLSVSSGRATSGALRPDGTMFTWGSDTYGSGGRNNTGSKSSPIQIPGTWSEVHMGYRSGGAIKADGTLWMWGNNPGGVLGQNQGPSQLARVSSPTQVGSDTWTNMAVFNQRVMASK
tara:strand:- start:142 stop:1320 length:1179 start_codon:yes stop_codon:yes gene_type:complete